MSCNSGNSCVQYKIVNNQVKRVNGKCCRGPRGPRGPRGCPGPVGPGGTCSGVQQFNNLSIVPCDEGLISTMGALRGEGAVDLQMSRSSITQIASGDFSFIAGGSANTASGDYSYAEGYDCTASGKYSHAEGKRCTASSFASHAEGTSNTASGHNSHAEGVGCTASNIASHAEGYFSNARGFASHASGFGSIAEHHQTYVWNDTGAFHSTNENQFSVKATGATAIHFRLAPVSGGTGVFVIDSLPGSSAGLPPRALYHDNGVIMWKL